MKFKFPSQINKYLCIIFEELLLILMLIIEHKLLYISALIASFSLLILGKILISINIPSSAIDTSFFTNVPIILNYSFIQSIFNTQFLLNLISVSLTFIITMIFFNPFYQKYKKPLLAITILFITSLLFYKFHTLSNSEAPIEAYIEMTGYPKIIQSRDHNYTLLGSNNMVYDLQKSLTPKRCQKIIDSNNSTPYPFYFALIQATNDDYSTFPNNSFTLKDDNMTYFDYNQSRRWVEDQCKNLLASTSKTKVPQ